MAYPIVLTEAAREDIGRAAAWYRARSARLAREFLTDVEDCLDRLTEFPRRHPVAHRQARGARFRRFPYMILYTIHEERIRAFGVLHLHRDPTIWREVLERLRRGE